jgi:putative MATE family efflux protein
MKIKNLIGDKAFYKMTFTVALPIMVQNFITNFVSMLDNLMVGNLGTEQISGVSIVNQLVFVFNLAIFGALSGAGIFTAQYFGKRDTDGIRFTVRFKVIITAVILLAGILIFTFFNEPLINMYLHEGDDNGNLALTLDYGQKYLNVIMWGFLPFCITQIFSSSLRETGETVAPMVAGFIAVVVNCSFNWVLIFGKLGFPQLGVEGAAIATCISNAVACVYFIVYLIIQKQKETILDFNPTNLKIKSKVSLDILSSGLSSFLMLLMAIFSNASINKLMSSYSAAAISGVSIAKKVDLCIIAFAQGLSNGILPLIGYNFASGDKKRMHKIIKFSMTLVLTFSISCIVLFFLFPRPIVSIFIKDTETIDFASSFLRILCVSMPLTAILFIFNTVFQGTKQNGKALVTIVLRKGIVDIPLMIALNLVIPIYGVVMSQPIVDVIGTIVGLILYIGYMRKEKKLLKEQELAF